MTEWEFLIFPSAVHNCCLILVQSLHMNKPLLQSLSFQKICLLVLLMMSSRPLTVLLERGVNYSHLIKQMPLSDLHQWKSILGNCQIPKFSSPKQSTLHHTWNRMCRGDYTCDIKNTGFCFSGIGHHSVVLCNTEFCLKGLIAVTRRGCRWCVQSGGKLAWDILLTWKKIRKKVYATWL